MRYTEFWSRMEDAMDPAFARYWASTQVLSSLGGRTVDEALAAGLPTKQVWRAVWEARGLPERDR